MLASSLFKHRRELQEVQFREMAATRRGWLVAALAFLCCFEYRLFAHTTGTFSFVIIEIAALIAVFIFILDWVVYERALIYLFHAVPRGGKLVLCYFLLTGIVSFAGLFLYGPYSLARWKDLFPSLVLFCSVSLWTWDDRTLKRVAYAYLLGVVVNVGLGMSQSLFGKPYPVELGLTALNKLDLDGLVIKQNLATGFFSHPNGLAMLLVPAVILTFGLLAARGAGIATKSLFLAFFCSSVFVLWHTYAKGAYVWAFWGILMILGSNTLKWRGPKWHVIALICSIGFIVFFGLARSYEIAGLGTMRGRVNQWIAALLVMREHPGVLLWGNGSDFISWKSLLASHMSYTYPNAHSWWINQVLMYGLPAGLLLMTGIWAVLKAGWNRLSFLPNVEPMRIVLFSAVLSMLGVYFFEPTIEGTTLQAQFFLLLALFAKFEHLDGDESVNAAGKS